MRTLQEKYNGIQEGKFSKEHFLAEARMQQPQLITRFNGYDDAVQILKNRGMIVEAKVDTETIKDVLRGGKKIATGVRFLNAKDYKDSKGKLGTLQTGDQVLDSKEINEAKQPKATKKGLADYRYKPTNEMDKYPYEQILRGIRVELEAAGVHGTPTPEEYTKALAKVSKNLEKDSIFYTNQVAGVNPKVDLHDKMVTATAKNTVDTFNGMKKAELKEGFKKLIKKVLSENLQEGYQKGDKVLFTNTNSDKTYKGTVVQDLGNGKFTFTAEDGKTYGSGGLGGNWKISKEVAEGNFEDPDLYDWDEERVERSFDEMESENYKEAEEEGLYEMHGERSDDEYKDELRDYLDDNQIWGYTKRIHDIMTGTNEETAKAELAEYLEDEGIYGFDRAIRGIYADYPYGEHSQDELSEGNNSLSELLK